MRALRGSLVFMCFAVIGLAACEPPPPADPVGAAVVEPGAPREPLPQAVAATVSKLREIAASGSYRDLAQFANQTPSFRSNNGGMTHQEYWYLKLRTGDWPMAQVEKLLSYHYAVADSAIGKVYVWPWMARLKPEEITPAATRDIDRLLGVGQAELLKDGKPWPGYVLGIAEDGTWLYFISGSG